MRYHHERLFPSLLLLLLVSLHTAPLARQADVGSPPTLPAPAGPTDTIRIDHVSPAGISHTYIDLYGVVYAGITRGECWIEWGETASLGRTTARTQIADSIIFVLHEEFFGLTPGTVYYFRAAAANEFGPSVGPIDTFRTIALGGSGGTGITFSLKFTNQSIWLRKWLGLHEDATYCRDEALGEWALPPLPPKGATDIRFVDPRGYSPCFDQGLYIDYRPLVGADQSDTFMVKIQSGSWAYPIGIEWPDLSSLFEGDAILRDAFGGVLLNVDMRSQNSLALSDPLLTNLVIILNGPGGTPLPVASLDSVIFRPGSSAELRGTVSPNSSETRTWFEYGTSVTYGSTTDTTTIDAALPVATLLKHTSALEGGQTYHFRVVATNEHGTYHGPDRTLSTSVTDVGDVGPVSGKFLLSRNYPNPFNPSTTIAYSLPTGAKVTLSVFDIHGREIERLFDGHKEPGNHSISWNASPALSSGVYFYRLSAGSIVEMGKMVIIR